MTDVKCEHKKQYWNDAGFRMCDDCEEILEFNGDVYVQNKLKQSLSGEKHE